MRLTGMPRKEQGDTIIEVVFAIVIFSLLAISSLAIMNQGIAAGEKALEVTLVRQQVNAQAEALRYIHEARVVSPDSASAQVWSRFITDYAQTSASPYGVSGGKCVVPRGSGLKPFILNARTAQIWSASPSVEPAADADFPPYPQVRYNADNSVRAAYGLWVESVPFRSETDKQFIDFHIRACWPAPGSAVPMTIGTIVRLYDPTLR